MLREADVSRPTSSVMRTETGREYVLPFGESISALVDQSMISRRILANAGGVRTWYMPGRLARPPRSRRPEPAALEKGEPLVVTVPPGPFVTLGELAFLPLPAAAVRRW